MVTFEYLRLLEYEMESTSEHLGIMMIADDKQDACVSYSSRPTDVVQWVFADDVVSSFLWIFKGEGLLRAEMVSGLLATIWGSFGSRSC
jgi:hypothetical protein